MKNLAGIDFGTTNSTAAITSNGNVNLVKLEQDFTTIPTALYFPEKKPIVYFGRDAQYHYTTDESDGRFMRSLKRILGTPLMNSSGTKINGRMTKFAEIIEFFIKHLKNKIDIAVGANVDSVVMGRPVYFRDNDSAGDIAAEKELRQITLNAGFKNVEFQFEPIAAAFAHERLLTSEKLAFVADIGGGTSDFTIIKLSPQRADLIDRRDDVLANTGVRIGGNDFDKDLSMESFMPELGLGSKLYSGINNTQTVPMPNGPYINLSTWNSINDLYTYKMINNIKGWIIQSCAPDKLHQLLEVLEKRLGHQNLDYVENMKIKLSDNDNVRMVLDFLAKKPEINSTRNGFEQSIKIDVTKIKKSIEECIKLSGVKNTDIGLVILTGGSTEIPYISDTMKSYFPNAELSASEKLSSVGLGLAYDAIRRF